MFPSAYAHGIKEPNPAGSFVLFAVVLLMLVGKGKPRFQDEVRALITS